MKIRSFTKRLSFRFSFLAFLVIVLPMSIALGVLGGKLRDDFKISTLNRFQEELESKSEKAMSMLEIAKGELAAFVQDINEDFMEYEGVKKGFSSGIPTMAFYHTELYKMFVIDTRKTMWKSTNYLQMRIIDTTGREIIRFNRTKSGIEQVPFEELQDKSKREYFKHIMEQDGGEVHVMPVSLQREHGKISLPPSPMVRIGRKIFLESGEVFGMAVLNVAPEMFFGSLPSEKKAGFLIIDEAGTYLRHWKKGGLFGKDLGHEANLLTEEPELKAALQRQDSRIHYDSELEEYRVWKKIFFDDDRSNYWIFMERHSEASIILPWMSVVYNGLRILTVVLILGFLIFMFVLRKILSPLNDLHAGIEELERGNLMARVPLKSKSRIGEITLAFNSMAEKLETASRELQAAKKQAEEATKLKDKFVSIVAHDLRAPFVSIIGFLQIILKDKEQSLTENQKDKLERVLSSAKNQATMVDELLRLNRLQTGEILPKFSFVDGRQLIDNTMEKLSYLAIEKGIEMLNEVPAGMRLYVDEELFSGVVLNLLFNAIKFSEKGDKIKFFKPLDRKTAIAIQDTGIGINEEMLPHLFKSETKTTTTGTAGEKGTGLGLPFSHEILQAHSGTLTVESSKGQGSMFIAELPHVKPCILLVEGDRVTRVFFKKHLEGLGAEILEAVNGEEALAILKDAQVHLIVSDLTMPVMDGFQLLKEIKKNLTTKSVPVIVITSDKEIETREKALRLGAADFAAKPMEPEDFIPRVRKFVG